MCYSAQIPLLRRLKHRSYSPRILTVLRIGWNTDFSDFRQPVPTADSKTLTSNGFKTFIFRLASKRERPKTTVSAIAHTYLT